MTGAEVEAALRDPTILRFLGKLQHADEWARSIEVSVNGGSVRVSSNVIGHMMQCGYEEACEGLSLACLAVPQQSRVLMSMHFRVCQLPCAGVAASDETSAKGSRKTRAGG